MLVGRLAGGVSLEGSLVLPASAGLGMRALPTLTSIFLIGQESTHGVEGITDPRLVCGCHDSTSAFLILTDGVAACMVGVTGTVKALVTLVCAYSLV